MGQSFATQSTAYSGVKKKKVSIYRKGLMNVMSL